jgi:hypothetical protein
MRCLLTQIDTILAIRERDEQVLDKRSNTSVNVFVRTNSVDPFYLDVVAKCFSHLQDIGDTEKFRCSANIGMGVKNILYQSSSGTR